LGGDLNIFLVDHNIFPVDHNILAGDHNILPFHLNILAGDLNILPGDLNLLKPTGHMMHQQFNIQQLYALPTLYLRVLYLFENKQRLVPLTA
jgi:hypothetical protein